MEYRKILVGSNLKEAFSWTIGQTVMSDYQIHAFKVVNDRVLVYIEKGDEIQVWKDFPLNLVSFQENIE